MSLDLLAFGEPLLRLQPEGGGRLEHASRLQVFVGGAEANTCCALSALGASCALFTVLPDGPLGRRVIRHLRGAGVDTSLVRHRPGRLGLYWTEYGPEPRGIDVVYDRRESVVTRVASGDVPWEALRAARVFYVTGITLALGDGPRAVALEMARTARAAGVTVATDLNYRARLWTPGEAAPVLESLAREADVVLATADDLATLYGLSGPAEAVAEAARARFGARTVVVTCGREGACSADAGGLRRHPAFATTTVDRVGAGDAFSAGFLYALLQDRADRALAYGLALAALKHGLPGDSLTTTAEELERILAGETRDVRR